MLTTGRYIKLQEEYIKDEQRSLKRELVRAQEEIKRIQSVPLVIGQFMEAIDQKCVSLTSDKPSHANQPQHWYRTIIHWIQLCRAYPFNARS
jgi:ATP-dependent 26S proteasome regulatory subunit